jgi:hypothetical protein
MTDDIETLIQLPMATAGGQPPSRHPAQPW